MAETRSTPDRTTLYVALLSFVAGVVSTGVGLYNARLNNEIAARQHVIEGHEKFAALVRDSLDALSDSKKASLSVAAIYAVAEDDAEKRIVITIAAATHSSEVQRVLTVLVGSDITAHRIASEENVTALIRQGLPIINPDTSVAALPGKALHRVRPVTQDAPPPNTAQTDLLAAIAQKSIGWVYYGRFGGVRSKDASECLSPSQAMPKLNETIMLCSQRYLRATKPAGSLGAIVGVAQPNVPMHVQNIALVPLRSGGNAVWLQVAAQ